MQNFFCMASQLFQCRHRIFRASDLYQFHFIKLVHTDQTTSITTVRTGFRTEAWRVCGHFQRQFSFIQNGVAH
ncbi:Uncharacterised protein [Vibrio cholerae]|nr:Uncharacterised protein [Vibrio cholerae]CSC39304.1 Uncharacterised protein [Vibrio cholerae]